MAKHCLVVDDSHVIRRITCQLLSALAFDTAEADCVSKALTACGNRMPELVLLDWSMPNDDKSSMSSLECIEVLRRLPGGKEPVVLYCTTEHDANEFERAINAGADDVIVKPFDRDMLHRKLIANSLA